MNYPLLRNSYNDYITEIEHQIDLDTTIIENKYEGDEIKTKPYNDKRNTLISKLDEIRENMFKEINKGNYPNTKVLYNDFQLIVFLDTPYTIQEFEKQKCCFDNISFSMIRDFIPSNDMIVYVKELNIEILMFYKYYHIQELLLMYPINIKYIKVDNLEELKYIPTNVKGLFLHVDKISDSLKPFTSLEHLIVISDSLCYFEINNDNLISLSFYYEYNHNDYEVKYSSLDTYRTNCYCSYISCKYLGDINISGSKLQYLNISKTRLTPFSIFKYNKINPKQIKEIICNGVDNCNMIIESITLRDPFKHDLIPNDVYAIEDIFDILGIGLDNDVIYDKNNIINSMTIEVDTCPKIYSDLESLIIYAEVIDIKNIYVSKSSLKNLEINKKSCISDEKLLNSHLLNNFTNLINLSIQDFKLSNAFTISNLKNLHKVTLLLDNFVYTKEFFEGLSLLKYIYIGEGYCNQDTFDDLIIEALVLYYNKSPIINRMFLKLYNLKYLSIEHNGSLKNYIFTDLPLLDTLETLKLSYVKLNVIYDFKDFTKLKTLKFYMSILNNYISGLNNIRNLTLEFNKIQLDDNSLNEFDISNILGETDKLEKLKIKGYYEDSLYLDKVNNLKYIELNLVDLKLSNEDSLISICFNDYSECYFNKKLFKEINTRNHYINKNIYLNSKST